MWVAYNQLFYKGKPSGKPFKVESGTTKAQAIAKAKKENTIWNKKNKNKDYSVAYWNVKETGTKKKKKTSKKPMSSFQGSIGGSLLGRSRW